MYRSYHLPDELWFDELLPDFYKLWKEEFQFYDQVPHDWKKQEPYRLFAQKMYNFLISDSVDKKIRDALQKTVDSAYKEGYDEGYDQGREDERT